jgi:capsid protein
MFAAMKDARERTVSATPKGFDLVRMAIAQAVCPGVGQAEKYAEARWGPKSRAARITKAAVPGLTTTAGAGAQMVSDEGARAEFFDLVRAQSLIGRLPLRRVPFFIRTLSMDEGPRVGWRDEGSVYATSPLKLTSQTGLEPLDVGALVVLSNELLNDHSAEAEKIIRDSLVKALATALDAAFIDPANTGSAGVKPAAVTAAGAVANSPMEGLFDWGDTYTGDPANSWIVMNPFQAARLNSAERPNVGARGGEWGGFPVLTSTACPEGIFVLLDPDQVALAIGNAEIRASDQASIEMSDGSSMTSAPSVTAATLTSMFQVNAMAIIGSLTANWRVIRPEAVQVFDAQDYGL